ncbi:hypothetical protein [Paenibacillus pini]|uniref:Uncharacterized protein n=1 Tax=Paenibacillus pini JCM 16418 TaxID=1236976 RepID=W7YJ70_9BACL|nr:hypothetical protein [Paenibacillus pini]GAF08517.1 hypothetical protein JCM16418_2599 [Paenibacillus pini JCM 16418]
MRIQSERYSWNEKNSRHGVNRDQSTPEFQLELQEQQANGKSDGGAKLVTCREGCFTRQYIVRPMVAGFY